MYWWRLQVVWLHRLEIRRRQVRLILDRIQLDQIKNPIGIYPTCEEQTPEILTILHVTITLSTEFAQKRGLRLPMCCEIYGRNRLNKLTVCAGDNVCCIICGRSRAMTSANSESAMHREYLNPPGKGSFCWCISSCRGSMALPSTVTSIILHPLYKSIRMKGVLSSCSL